VFLNILREYKSDDDEGDVKKNSWGHTKREEETKKTIGHDPPPLPPLPPPSDIKKTQNQLRKHICALQIVEHLSSSSNDDDDDDDKEIENIRSVSRLIKLWRSTLYLNRKTGNKDEDEREVQQGDDLLLMAVRRLGTMCSKEEKDVRKVWQHTIDALSILEMGLSHSSHNFMMKLYMVHLYASIGAIPRALELYDSVKVKNIQLDTLTHHIGDAVFGLGFLEESRKIHGKVVGFHREVFHDTAEYASLAFKHNNVCKVHDIVEMWRKLKCSHQLCVSRSYADIMDMWHNIRDVNRYLKGAKLQSSSDNVESLMESSLEELSSLRYTEDLSMCLSAGFMSFSPWRDKATRAAAGGEGLHPIISDLEAKELRLRSLIPGLLLDAESLDRKNLLSRVKVMKKICTPSWRIVVEAFSIMLRLVVLMSTKSEVDKDTTSCEMFSKLVSLMKKKSEDLCSGMSMWSSSGPSSSFILSQSWTFMSRSLFIVCVLLQYFAKHFAVSSKKKKSKKGKKSKKSKKTLSSSKLSFDTVSSSISALYLTCMSIVEKLLKRIKKEISDHKNGWSDDVCSLSSSSTTGQISIVLENTLRGQKKCLLNLMKGVQHLLLYLRGLKL